MEGADQRKGNSSEKPGKSGSDREESGNDGNRLQESSGDEKEPAGHDTCVPKMIGLILESKPVGNQIDFSRSGLLPKVAGNHQKEKLGKHGDGSGQPEEPRQIRHHADGKES
jgi:hypothetical protein